VLFRNVCATEVDSIPSDFGTEVGLYGTEYAFRILVFFYSLFGEITVPDILIRTSLI
jgi:hypothetical protein